MQILQNYTKIHDNIVDKILGKISEKVEEKITWKLEEWLFYNSKQCTIEL